MLQTYQKPPLTILEQLSLLRKRGLSILDDESAGKFLARVNYYRLSVYYIPFEISRHRFKGTTFEEVRGLYEFDRDLRLLLMEAIEMVEISFRTKLAYTLGHDTRDPFCHHKQKTFNAIFLERDFDKWHQKLRVDVDLSRDKFIDHYREKYEGFPQLPIWIAVEVMSMTALSKLFKGLKESTKLKIASDTGIRWEELESMLQAICIVRNICAHHGRIFGRKLPKSRKPKRWPEQDTGLIGYHLRALQYLVSKFDTRIGQIWEDRFRSLISKSEGILPDFQARLGLVEQGY